VKIDFYKYHGNGNDFILFDNRSGQINFSTDQIKALCHRRFGIGSDGIILIENHEDCDYNMVFYNPDGSQSFCGNGSRCALHLAKELSIIDRDARFLAIDGFHEGIIDENGSSIHMKDVQEIEVGNDYYFLNTGSPHYVKIVPSIENIDVYTEGRQIRYNDRFKQEGTNVNFVELSDGKVKSRVYERGVENETYSSGTGTTAVAISSYLKQESLGEKIVVETKGGPINVTFKYDGNGQFTNIWLIGHASPVYKGQIEI
jgi:diaminopimelate epimerase